LSELSDWLFAHMFVHLHGCSMRCAAPFLPRVARQHMQSVRVIDVCHTGGSVKNGCYVTIFTVVAISL